MPQGVGANPKFNLAFTPIWAGSTFHNDMADSLRAIDRQIPGVVGKKSVVYSGRETSTRDGIQAISYLDINI